MRSVTSLHLLLLPTIGLALACASPNSASTPAAEEADARSDRAPAGAARPGQVDPSPDSATAPAAEPEAEPEAKPDTELSKDLKAKEGHGDAFAPEASRPTQGASSRLEIEVPMINGGLNRDIIRRTASDHADDIRACHGRALAAMPGLAGTIVIALSIDADGSVSEAELGDASEFANRDVQDCVLALARGWQFPKPSGSKQTSVELAFEFGLE